MSAISSELAPNERGLVALIRNSLSRDEFFAGLFILGCANGLMGRMLYAFNLEGWAGFVTGVDINLIVLFAFYAGVSAVLSEGKHKLRLSDLIVGCACLVLICLPVYPLSWVAVTVLSLYILLFANGAPDRKRGAVILLTLTMPMLWSRLVFQFFANFILEFDAWFAAALLGTSRVGNTLSFGDGSGILVITPACSSFANVSIALLCWVSVTQWAKHRWAPSDLVWCFLACASVIGVNVTRIAVTGMSQANYAMFHNEWSEMVLSTVMVILITGFSLFGARRELFPRV